MDIEQSDDKLNENANSTIDNILPTSNEEEMKNLMKDLDREQAYREHKCWRQYITVIISIILLPFSYTQPFQESLQPRFSALHIWPLFSCLPFCSSLLRKKCRETHFPGMMCFLV